MIIAWVVFIIGCLSSFIWLVSCYIQTAQARKVNRSIGNFWLWLIITTFSAQYIWG